MRPLFIILLLGAACLSTSAQRFVKVFDNVAALLAANPNDVHTNAWVAGRATANDGGGGIYTWHSTSTASTNSNLGVLKANNFSTGRWFRDNGFRLTDFPVNYAVVVGPDGILTNGAITVVELNRLSGVTANIQSQIDSLSGGSSNWVDEGATNATLPGIAKYWKGVITNSLEIGQPNEQGVITLFSTNATYTNEIFVDVDGLLTFTSGGTPVAYIGDEGSFYARRILALQNSDLNADDVVRIQPTDFLMNSGTTTNDFFIDIAAGTIRMRHDGTNTFSLVQDSGYLGGGTLFLSDDGTYKSAVGDTIWTNDNGTIRATSPVADGGTAFQMDSDILTSGTLFKVNNNNTNILEVTQENSVSGRLNLRSINNVANVFLHADESNNRARVDVSFDDGVNASEIILDAAGVNGPSIVMYSTLNFDEVVRIQPGELLLNIGSNTNDFEIDLTAGTILKRHEGTNTFAVAQDSGYGAGGLRALTDQAGTYLEVLSPNSTNALTNKSYDAGGTGNVLKFTDYKDFVYPGRVDGTGCIAGTTNTANVWGLASYSGTADTNGNYAIFNFGIVPFDLDTSAVMILRGLSIRTDGSDTDAAQFTIALYSPTSSGDYLPSDFTGFSTFINFDTGALTSPALNNWFQCSDVTMTGWPAALTPGKPFLIAIARRNGNNDDVVSIVSGTLEYGRTK